MLKRWRRLDEPGLELLRLDPAEGGFLVASSLVHAGADPFGLQYRWSLDEFWRTKWLRLALAGSNCRGVEIKRVGESSWRVDGQPRLDLDGCEEIDLSATPFSNSLAILRLGGATGELTAAYIEIPKLTIRPSRQRYEVIGENCWRYIDLGVVRGFEAQIELDAEGLVSRYEGLFAALPNN